MFIMPQTSEKTARPNAASKPMSNRLLTMTFMKRAAASSPQSKTETAAIKAATAAEEARREAATLALRPRPPISASVTSLDIETQWELSYISPPQWEHRTRIIGIGISELDNEDDDGSLCSDEEFEENVGRRVFGNFRKQSNPDTPVKSEALKDEDESESESDLDRASHKRAKKDILRGLVGISNAGAQQIATMQCRACGKIGHKAVDCPGTDCYACGKLGHKSSDCQNSRGKRKEPHGRRDDRPKKVRR